MKNTLLSLLGTLAVAGLSQAAITFTIGTAATAGGVNNWPTGEPPGFAIDGLATTKYLNFAEFNTGYIFTPAAGASTVTGINFTTANDAVERDPSSYTLYGSNSTAASSVPGTVFDVGASFTQISTGALALTDTRLTAGGNVTFANGTAYNTYLLVFPTTKNVSANSMQIGEARLQTAAGDLDSAGVIGGGQLVVPEPTTALLGALGALGLAARRRRS